LFFLLENCHVTVLSIMLQDSDLQTFLDKKMLSRAVLVWLLPLQTQLSGTSAIYHKPRPDKPFSNYYGTVNFYSVHSIILWTNSSSNTVSLGSAHECCWWKLLWQWHTANF